jgi:hypothetical protein
MTVRVAGLLLIVWSAALLAGGWWCADAAGQEVQSPAPKPAEPATPAQPPVVEEPPIRFPDDEGNYITIPGMTLQRIKRLLELESNLARTPAPPEYTLESVVASGTVGEKHAELKIAIQARVSSSKPLRIPLRLGECILREPAHLEGPGEQYLDVKDGGGYEWWITPQGSSPATHRLELSALAPLEAAGGETLLRLTMPRSPAAGRTAFSKLALFIPGEEVAVSVLGGKLPEQGITRRGDGQDVTVLDLDGTCTLRWHPKSRPLVTQSSDVRADALLICEVDGRSRLLTTLVDLKIRSLGGMLGGLTIRLPPGEKLTTRDARLVSLEEATAAEGQLLKIVHDPQAETVHVRFQTERSFSELKPDESLVIRGPQVPRAVSHGGHLALRVKDGWQAWWGDPPATAGMRRVGADRLPQEHQTRGIAAVFEYWGAAPELRVQVHPLEPRIQADPLHELEITASGVRLNSRITFLVDRAPAMDLAVDLADFEIDDLGPAELIDQTALQLQQRSPFRIRLKQPMQGRFEIEIQAHRTHGPSDGTLDIPLPRVDDAPRARVVIRPAANVSVTPGALVGLAPWPGAIPAESRGRTPELWYATESPAARFTGHWRLQPRRVTSRTTGKISLSENRLHLEAQLLVKVESVPLTELVLRAPAEMAGCRGLQFRLNGAEVEPGTEPRADGSLRYRIVVPNGAGTDSFTLAIGYELPYGRLGSELPAHISVPLPMVEDAAAASAHLAIAAPPNIEVRASDGAWQPAADSGSGQADGSGLALESAAAPLVLRLQARKVAARADEPVLVDRTWIQTWLGDRVREDRWCVRVTTAADRLIVRLPEAAGPWQAWLDGQPAAPKLLAADEASPAPRLLIRLPSLASSQSRVLEVRYRLPGGFPSLEQRLEAARIEGDAGPGQTYWQLNLPPDRHLVWTAPQVVHEFAWSWRGGYFGRQPLLSTADLARWCGVPQPSNAAPSANQYLFSHWSPAEELRVATARRQWIVGLASLGVFAAGLLVLYVPFFQRRLMVLAAALGLSAWAMAWPDPAVLFLQAAALGMLALLTAVALRRLMVPGRAQPLWLGPGGSSILEHGSTEQEFERPLAGLGTTTVGEPLAAPSPGGRP